MIFLPIVFFVLLLLNVPIAFILGIVGTIGLFIGDFSLRLLPSRLFSGMDSFVLMAIPFFILTGELMNEAKITDKIIAFSSALVGKIKGGLGHVNVVASIIFAGMSGVAVADVAALGSILIPGMTKAGYDKNYATALTAASSIIGPIIPPSMSMVIYGAIVHVSIAGMFAAGVIPGLIMGILMMVFNYFISSKRGYETKKQKNGECYFKNLRKTLIDGIFALILPIILIGGILGGVFSPTEAAAVAAGYAFILGLFVYRTLTFQGIKKVLRKSVTTVGVAMLLVSTGRVLSWLISVLRIAPTLSNNIQDFVQSNVGFLLLVSVILLIVGTFNDLTASIIIFAPLLAPIAVKLGIPPLQFGLTMILSLNIGLNTPPVGAVLFVASSVANTTMEAIVKEIFPFYLCQVATLLAIIFLQPVTLYLPRILGF